MTHGRARAEEEAGTGPAGREVVEEAPATSEKGEKIKAELDDLLDEIDEVLEDNAEDFVESTSRRAASSRPLRSRGRGACDQ